MNSCTRTQKYLCLTEGSACESQTPPLLQPPSSPPFLPLMIFFLLLGLIRFGTLVEAGTTTAPLPQQASYLGGTNDSTRLDLPLFVFNFGTLSYFLPSTIGTPPQPLNLTLAFGQPGVVVVGEGCVPGAGFDGCQQAAEPFNASASSTFVVRPSTSFPQSEINKADFRCRSNRPELNLLRLDPFRLPSRPRRILS
ncbi:hypothetical protein BDY24DRAFT_184026 [Mrakia frigida]|uniref:uncharacterized protein n=1 Tax=Mrakia frigida TaxID=29902 RepID=UPI003FCBEE81